MDTNPYRPARYSKYEDIARLVISAVKSDLTADMIRTHVAKSASGAVIVADEIKDNPARWADYLALKKITDKTVDTWRGKTEIKNKDRRGYAASTVSRMLTECKRHLIIDKGLDNHPAIALLELDTADAISIKKRGTERGNQRAKERRPFYDIEGIIRTAVDMVKSDSYLKIITGLVLLTGRRPSEIIITGKFKRVSKYSAIFSGQLKTAKDARITGKTGGNDRDSYKIPLLSDFATIDKAVKKLRSNDKLAEMIKDMGGATGAMTLPQVVNSRLASNCRAVARDSFIYRIPDFLDGSNTPMRKMTTYTLRGVYAKINSMRKGLTDETESSFIREILGHSYDTNLNTSAAYDNCYYAGATLPHGTIVKKAGADISNLDIKGLDIGAIQSAGKNEAEPVTIAEIYQPVKKESPVISTVKRILKTLKFW
jgi:integrase